MGKATPHHKWNQKLMIGLEVDLKTGLVPAASGSAYLELKPSRPTENAKRSGLKLTCAVHGPRPLPRSAPFSPQLLLSTRIKFAPFSASERKGYVPDAVERDLASHLETALRGVVLAEKWPKSGLDILITVLEGEEDYATGNGSVSSDWALMNVLSGCITVASAAIADAGVDSIDLVTAGVAANVFQSDGTSTLVLDPCPYDGEAVGSLCLVAYSQSRDEITHVWARKGQGIIGHTILIKSNYQDLLNNAVEAASAARMVLVDALRESIDARH